MDIPIEKITELIEVGCIAKKKKRPLIIIQDNDGVYSFHIGTKFTPKIEKRLL